jgi:uncharacterized repeat protein (TIGR02543 family)
MSYSIRELSATATGPTTATLTLTITGASPPSFTWSVSGSGTESPASGSSGTSSLNQTILVTGLSPNTSYFWSYTLGGSAGSASGTSNSITTPSPYTVTWNANGGSVSPTSSSGVTVTAPTPTRSGFSFNGWYTAASGGTFVVAAGGSYTPSSNITLYAQWTAITYTVTWNANGGTVTPASNSGTSGTVVTAPTPTRTGYSFNGWYTASSGGTLVVNGGASYTITSTVTLYAQWTANTYTVSYNANGGTGAPTSQTKTHDVALTLTLSTPTRTGYTFSSWNTAANGTGTYYASGASYTANASVTLYAQWTPNTYTVSYDANGGTGAPTSQTKTHDVALTLSSTVPTRTGYTFVTWNTAINGTGTSYSPGSSYTTNAGATLYAQWSINTYTVSYDANGGTGAPTSQTKTYNVTLTLTSSTPTRSGYTFSNWNTLANGSGTTYSSGGSYTANASATLYAQWTINAPVWTDNTLATPILGRPYSDAVSATNSPTYSVSSGALPTGLSLNSSTGSVTGTPTAVGPFTFTITASNAGGSVSQTFTNIYPTGGLNTRGTSTWTDNKIQAYNGSGWVTETVWVYNGSGWDPAD